MTATLLRDHASIHNPLVNGATLNATTLNAAVAAIGGADRVLMLTGTDRDGTPGVWTIDANVTIPDNVTLWVPQGASVTINAGSTLTLNQAPLVGNYAWIAGAGDVTYGDKARQEVMIAWRGAVGDGVADDTTALQQVITEAGIGATIRWAPGTYLVRGGLVPLDWQRWVCNGATLQLGANIDFASEPGGVLYLIRGTSLSRFQVDDLNIFGDHNNQSQIPTADPALVSMAFRFDTSSGVQLNNITIKQYPGYGVRFYGSSDNHLRNFRCLDHGAPNGTTWTDRYNSNNFADGITFSAEGAVTSDHNTVDGFEVSRSAGAGIADGNAFRCGVCVIGGSHNTIKNGRVYNGSRGLQIEPNVTTNRTAFNRFQDVEMPAIGDMDHSVVVFWPGAGGSLVHDNLFDNINAQVGSRDVSGAGSASLWIAGNSPDFASIRNYSAKFQHCYFANNIELTGPRFLFEDCRIANDITEAVGAGTPSYSTFRSVQARRFSLPQASLIRFYGCKFFEAQNDLQSGGTAIDVAEFHEIVGCVFEVATIPAGLEILSTRSPVRIADCTFSYTGAAVTTGSYLRLVGFLEYSGHRIPMLISRNLFVGNGEVAGIVNHQSSFTYQALLPDNIVFGTLTNGMEFNSGNRTEVAPSGIPSIAGTPANFNADNYFTVQDRNLAARYIPASNTTW